MITPTTFIQCWDHKVNLVVPTFHFCKRTTKNWIENFFQAVWWHCEIHGFWEFSICLYIQALQFFNQWDPQKASVKSVCQTLSGGQFSVLKIKCKFVSGHYSFAHLLWDELTQIFSELKRYANGVLPLHTQQMLQVVKGDVAKANIKYAISS
ncbi:hypothetical protein PR048_023422 [Dryococelus australis]|uniref:Uncharacterized protein n=1 Tax=Dryococelus australis TaxID=614101 RepID=A0ABQ9GU24_9NEOP|nr:hypothetical protein PR048_023422 [Dryococelus australis]